jgi:uncharacterized membrane protein
MQIQVTHIFPYMALQKNEVVAWWVMFGVVLGIAAAPMSTARRPASQRARTNAGLDRLSIFELGRVFIIFDSSFWRFFRPFPISFLAIFSIFPAKTIMNGQKNLSKGRWPNIMKTRAS